jgi:two-component system, cell cycle response regulator
MTLAGGRRIALRAVQLVSLLALAGYAAQAAWSVCGTGADELFEIYVYNALLAVAAGLCLVRAAAAPRERPAWLVLGGGLLAWAAGEAYYSLFLDQLESPPVPSVSDGLWLAFYPACYVAIVLLVRERVTQFRSSLWLDGVVGALAAGAIAAALIFGTVVDGGEDSSVIAVDLAYAIGDLLLLGFVVAVFGLTGWRPGRALLMVGAALATGAVVDGWFLYNLATGQTVDTTLVASLWPLSALMLGFAAWQRPAEAEPIRLEGWRVLLMPSAFAASALALLGYHTIQPQNALALALAVATLAAVIVRMAMTFRQNIELLDTTRREALTDALTGLRNRRALVAELEQATREASAEGPVALVMLDLDGFKQYNDRFGHPMGDALLARLAAKLQAAAEPYGARAYRLGGDEFCLLAAADEPHARGIARAARTALSEQGEGFIVTSTYGAVVLPLEARDASAGLRIADGRLYAHKDRRQRSSAGTQTSAALLQALEEREPELRDHLDHVAKLSMRVGGALGLGENTLDDLARAAHLHDVGKIAVPEAILQKPGGLDAVEWELVRQHTIAGERILNAAPALSDVAKLVRSSHERFDGGGYPDGLVGHEIPLGARIIAACDAFHSMTSRRTYGRVWGRDEALTELRRCAGHQFDPRVVDTICALLGEEDRTPVAEPERIEPAAQLTLSDALVA